MKLEIFQIDTFTDKALSGNSAAVCPLDHWLPDHLMQKIAEENNVSDTCFFVQEGATHQIRWFTPTIEVDLCGHATLAAAHVLYHHKHSTADEIVFDSRSGLLRIKRSGDFYTLDFPSDPVIEVPMSNDLSAPFNLLPTAAFKGQTDYLFVFDSEQIVASLTPDMTVLSKLDCRGIIATAKGDTVDFVSRFFAPQSGVNEDPVTGSAHTTLTPYWSAILGKQKMHARQISQRAGVLICENLGERVAISGQAVTYLQGTADISGV